MYREIEMYGQFTWLYACQNMRNYTECRELVTCCSFVGEGKNFKEEASNSSMLSPLDATLLLFLFVCIVRCFLPL